jgi:hypothetical protein
MNQAQLSCGYEWPRSKSGGATYGLCSMSRFCSMSCSRSGWGRPLYRSWSRDVQ